MERQDNGFKKITEACYAAHNYCAELEPKFYSDAVSFQVTLYNLNYGQATTARQGEQAIENTETGDCSEKQAIEQAIANLNISQTAKKHIASHFNNFGVEGVFGRTEIARTLKITVSTAGELINKMKSAELIEAVTGFGKGKYKFIQK